MTVRLILVGCGNMGYAMLSGWLKSGRLSPAEVFVAEPNATLRDRAKELGAQTGKEAADLPDGSRPEIVVIAVKPQAVREVLDSYRGLGTGAATFLSIVAGTPVATFEKVLGVGTPVVRCMPNTPAAIGQGMMVLFANQHVRPETQAQIADLLSVSGAVAAIWDESLMDAVTAVSGSGPAYVFHFIECLGKAGEATGLPRDTARMRALQTVFGAACLAAETGTDPGELRRQVTSPNGTTAAALDILMNADELQTLLSRAVEAAQRRSVELGR